MDLPTCPACGQSVLDDDAAECPFCGSPMKGGARGATRPAPSVPAKPAAKAPAAKHAASKTGPQETKAAPSAAPQPSAKPKSDDPFDFEGHAGQGAVAVIPKPAKGRTLEVACPMCETKGFVPPTAAGKEAKCCNPNCRLPIFTVPRPKVEEAAPPPPARSSMPLFIGVAAVILVGVAFGAFFFLNPPPKNVQTSSDPNFLPETTESSSTTTTAGTTVDVGPQGPSNAEVISSALKSTIESAIDARSLRALARRVASVAATLAGDEEKAREHIARLKDAEKDTEDDQIVPLVGIAWRQWEGGNAEAAKRTLEDAFGKVKFLEPLGRYRSEAALHLAALLAAHGRHDDGWLVLKQGTAGLLLDGFTSAVEVARANRSFDLDEQAIGESVGEWNHPQAVGVTLLLGARGRWDEALAWAKSAEDAATRGEALLVWGEAYAEGLLAQKTPLDKVLAVLPELSPGEKPRLLARIAARQIAAGDQSGATATLTTAAKALADVPPVDLPSLSTLRDILDLKLPEAYPMRIAALAAADLGSAQAQLQQPEAPWKNFQTALTFTARTGPTRAEVAALAARVESLAAVRADLKLGSDDLARRRQADLRQKIALLDDAADVRRTVELDLYEAAIDAGLLTEVWGDVQKSEVLLRSGLPSLLVTRAQRAKLSDLEKAVVAAIPADFQPSPRGRQEISSVFLDRGNVVLALKQLPPVGDKGVMYEWRLKLVCRAIKAKKLDDAVTMLAAMAPEATFQAAAVQFASALATRLNQREAFRKAAGRSMAQPANKAALFAGVIDALASPPAPAPAR